MANSTDGKTLRQRVTAFVDPALVMRAKVRGALEGLTISEIVEKALESYAPLIEKDSNQHINLKFTSNPALDALIPVSKTQTVIRKQSKRPANVRQ